MDRKALIRAYKETRRPMGIYRVRQLSTGRSLIGRSMDLPSILNRERAALKFGGHSNAELQRDWNACGPDDFVFEVLDTLVPKEAADYDPSDDLRLLEAMWIERIVATDGYGYMRRPAAGT